MEPLRLLWNTVAAELKPVEVVAAVTSLFCVYLTVKNNIWNWFWGLVGSALYGYIFFRVSHLYANAALQALYFVPMQFLGFWVWWRGNETGKTDALPVTSLTNGKRLAWGGATLALTGVLYYGLPYVVSALGLPPQQLSLMDGFTTGLSISAQFLQTYKKWENWVLWIIADVIYTVYIFPQLKMPVTTLLYAVFTVLAIAGLLDWLRLMKKTQQNRRETER